MIARFASLLALGAVLLVVRSALWTERLTIEVEPDEDVTEAILVDQGLRGGWIRTDPILRNQLAESMRFAGHEGANDALIEAAIAAGLHESDPLVRARIVERVRSHLSAVPEPGLGTLTAYYDANAERYRSDKVVSFEHYPVDRDPIAGLDRVQAGTEVQIAARFGEEFAAALMRVPAQKPAVLTSSYGDHTVLVQWFQPGRLPTLAEVDARVRADWKAERRAWIVEQRIAALQARYRVVVR